MSSPPRSLPDADTAGEVAAAVEEAAKAGGVIVKRPTTPLGGTSALLADPDGHVWEAIRHPLHPLGADGRPEVP